MNRRHFITTTGAAVAGSLITTSSQAAMAEIGITQDPLAYPPEALEPHIDAITMGIHHGKHHATYVTKLGEALTAGKIKPGNVITMISDLASLPAEQQTAVRNHGGGHVNHTLFWKWMAPAGSGPTAPEGKLV